MAKAGEGQVVLLSGEAGIGKSRLTAAFLERLAGEPHARLRYFCSPQHTDSALHPIIVHMERAAGFAREDDAKLPGSTSSTPCSQRPTSLARTPRFSPKCFRCRTMAAIPRWTSLRNSAGRRRSKR